METLTDLVNALGPDAAAALAFLALTFTIGVVLVVRRIFASLDRERDVHAHADVEALKDHVQAAVQEAVRPLQRRLNAIENRLDEGGGSEAASDSSTLPREAQHGATDQEPPLGGALDDTYTGGDHGGASVRNTSSRAQN